MEMTSINLADKIAERLKNSELGEYVDEADLYDIVRAGIEKVLFEPRDEVLGHGYSQQTITKPPRIQEVVAEQVEKVLTTHVQIALAKHTQEILDLAQPMIERRISLGFEAVVNARTKNMIDAAVNGLVTAINNDRRNAGLPEIYPVY
jgi:hypothetical protein